MPAFGGFFVCMAVVLLLGQVLLLRLLLGLRGQITQEPLDQQVARTLMQQQLTQLVQDHSGVQHKLDELLRTLQSTAINLDRRQEAHGDALGAALAQHRQEATAAFQGFHAGLLGQLGQGQTQQLEQLRQFFEGLAHQHRSMQNQLTDIRGTVEQRLVHLQDDNAKRLEQMRVTVDEKLQSTLEARLGASFKQVSERLEEVYKGLGEMQALATGVGDLKRVLTNVKTRGTWGEVQLHALSLIHI
jgi:DNA recombination protein RmuC